MRILLLLLLPIGDTLFTTPAIHALRRRYPGARITALVYPTNAGVLRANPDIDDFIFWYTRQSWPGIAGVRDMFRRLRAARFDLAVEFSNYSGWLTLLSRIPRRSEMHLPRLWWVRPGAGREWRKRHAVEHYADVVRRLGIPVDDLSLRMYSTPEESARAEAWLCEAGMEDGTHLAAIHPGGEGLWGRKQWGVERFATVAQGLYKEAGVKVIILGGKDDVPLARQIAARAGTPCTIAAGHTSLGETAALVERCAVFIGNDSSPLHIAAAMGTPAVGIYGPTDPRSYRPWVPGGRDGRDYAVVRSPLRCACRFPLVGGITLVGWSTCLMCPALTTIRPEQVLRAAKRLLAGQQHAGASKDTGTEKAGGT